MPRRESNADNSPGKVAQGRQIVEIRHMRSYFLRVGRTSKDLRGMKGVVRDHYVQGWGSIEGFGDRRH